MSSHSFGRRSPKGAPAIALADILRTTEPVYPPAVDYLAALDGGWKMLGNDFAGDCVAVTWANVRRLVTATLAKEKYPTLAQVWKIYATQNPDFDPKGSSSTNGPGSAADGGMDIQTLLEYLVKEGGADGVKAVAFAKVNINNEAEVRAAIAIFGYLWTGINVLAVNDDEFNEGEPWDYVADSPLEGGHSVVSGGYTSNAANDVQFITWAVETGFTDSFWTHEAEEAWVVIWPEHFDSESFEAGVNQAALAAAYQEITGNVLPVPAPPEPTPTPTPTPVPTPPAPPTPTPTPDTDPDDVALAEAVEEFVDTKHLAKDNKDAAAALKAWEEEKDVEPPANESPVPTSE